MTIGLTDLLRRTRPFVITALPLVILQACGPKEMNASFDRVDSFLTGKDQPTAAFALTTQSSSSAEPVVEQIAVTTEPSSSSSEEVCHVMAFRDFFIDCHGFNVEGPER